MISYIYLEVTLSDKPAIYPLSHGAELFFNYCNIILCFVFMGAWGLFLTIAIRRTEQMLEQRNKELYDVEKEAEHSEIQRQLEVWERDNEIYRLRNVELKASYDEIAEQKKLVEEEKRKSEELLLNILPEETAQELLREGHAKSHGYDNVTIMFTDFVGFTKIAEREKAEDLVQHIDRYFRAFDEITLRHNVEKIKTIGDAYMCAGGLPTVNNSHPMDVMNAAMDIIKFMEEEHSQMFHIRVGVHTGPVVAGVVGHHKFQYDIWGDAVNVAARMEQHSTPGRINISGSTYELVKDHFECEHRGKVAAKNKGELEMYFVKGRKAKP
jgi:class 3 adenylate cyclase